LSSIRGIPEQTKGIMKGALFTILTAASVAAQSSTDGTIVFKSIGIQNAAGTGTYNVPLFANNHDNDNLGNGNSSTPAGLVPGGVTVGLFLSSNLNAPLAIGQLGDSSGPVARQPYIITPQASQTVTVPGQPPGSTPSLTIRAWTTSSGSFLNTQRYGGHWGEWVITSKPLGGVPAGGGTPITPPTLTGWGSENGSGFELNFTDAPEPSTMALGVLGVGALALARRRQ
jgi:MYXO-CTERM domain-containing protein